MTHRVLSLLCLCLCAQLAWSADTDALPEGIQKLSGSSAQVTGLSDEAVAFLNASSVASSSRPSLKFNKGATNADVARLADMPWVNTLEFRGIEGPVDLAPLASCQKLATLFCLTPEVTNLQVLQTLPELKTVKVIASIEDLDWVKGMPAIVELNLHNVKTVKDYSGLAGHPTLTTLNISGHPITPEGLAQVATSTGLLKLDFAMCEMRDVDGIAPLKNLKVLNLGVSRTMADIGVVAELPALSELQLGLNQVTDLSPLKGHQTLRVLTLWKNEVTDLSPLAGLPSLERVSLSETPVTDISPLASCPKLESLTLTDSPVQDIAPLAACGALEMLNLNGTKVTDVSALAKCPQLEYLNLQKTEGVDIAPLATFPKLRSVVLPKATPEADVAALKAAKPGLTVSLR